MSVSKPSFTQESQNFSENPLKNLSEKTSNDELREIKTSQELKKSFVKLCNPKNPLESELEILF